ncbi:hypothetical protein WSS_A33410 [Rhodococcus opacus M213]|uniref:Uncharacterized protein n=1 Tax=Rhodococcus opacus M213 TaxID=1129896 RepID=K8XIY8_RHOOP|nr:hypothetical protein WSS_A33410 [Rhodococcus opacus M213]
MKHEVATLDELEEGILRRVEAEGTVGEGRADGEYGLLSRSDVVVPLTRQVLEQVHVSMRTMVDVHVEGRAPRDSATRTTRSHLTSHDGRLLLWMLDHRTRS